MGSRKIEDLSGLDWDDSALIKAYNKGLRLKAKELEKEKNPHRASSNKENAKTGKKWKVGDYCRAMYSMDSLLYEAKITALNDDSCTVIFLGYGDEEEVEINTLNQSRGKQARKKQRKQAKECIEADESGSGEDTNDLSESQESYCNKKRVHILNNSQVNDHSAFDYTAAETTLQSTHHETPHSAAHYYYPPVAANPMPVVPPPPPMPNCPDIAQNPSLSAVLTAWYMAGYYTGFHQGQKGSQCMQRCSHVNQSCCHHL